MQNHDSALQRGNDPAGSIFKGWPTDRRSAAERHLRPVSATEFVDAMRGAVTGVNIVTTDGAAGRFGVTVSAFSSVSAEPPMVLVCINRRSPVSEALSVNRCFAVNVLASSQQGLADIFAGHAQGSAAYDFRAARWNAAVTGSPVLPGSVASLDCAVATTADAGTHRIFIGRVMDVSRTATDPLLYSNRGYGRVGH